MPSGHKRWRKSSKRKSAIQSLNPLPIPSSQENGERAFVVGGEEEGEEKFQTPRFHLDPIDLPAASLMSQRRGEIKEKMRAIEEKSMINEEVNDKNGILDGEKGDGVDKDGILETEEGYDVDKDGILETEEGYDVKDGILEKEWEDESVENLEDVQEVEVRNNEGLKEEKVDDNLDDGFGIHDAKEELDTSLKEREVKGMHEKKDIDGFSSYVAGIEKDPLIEIARGPLVVKHATIWNCCGLLDVFNGSGS